MNEIAVAAFLNNQIGFTQIPQIVEQTLNRMENAAVDTIDVILQADRGARYCSAICNE